MWEMSSRTHQNLGTNQAKLNRFLKNFNSFVQILKTHKNFETYQLNLPTEPLLAAVCKGAIPYSTWFNPVKWRAIKREIWQICLQIVDLQCKILLHFSYHCVLRWIKEVGLNIFLPFQVLIIPQIFFWLTWSQKIVVSLFVQLYFRH